MNLEELEFYLKKGKELFERGALLEAVNYYKRAVSIKPDYYRSYLALGDVFMEMSKFDTALRSYKIAVRLSPQNAEAYYKIGVAYLKLKRYREAEKFFLSSLKLDGRIVDSYNGLYLIYKDLGLYGKAERVLKAGIELAPECAKLYNNLGNVYHAVGKYDLAMNMYTQAITLAGDFPEAELGRGLIYLLRGEFNKGWEGYEKRFFLPTFRGTIEKFGKKIWDGTFSPSKTLLVWTEQGIGDAIQFVRFLPYVKERVGRVILACQGSLFRLFKTVKGIDELIDKDREGLPEYDFHIPIMSVGKLFVREESDIPAEIPYFDIPPDAVFEMGKRVGISREKLNVGIVWGGNIRNKNNRVRSTSLRFFIPLGEIDGLKLYSLQKGEYLIQLENDGAGSITDLSGIMEDFYDTALVVKNMDLIITVDTAVAHLAGALGIKVWLLIPQYPDWRWQLERADSPWYPSMRIFRQNRQGYWQDVFEKVRREILRVLNKENGN